jgi:GNAT superfamily N-acetyltransferase
MPGWSGAPGGLDSSVVRGEAKFIHAQAHLTNLRLLLDQYRARVSDTLFVVSTAQDGGIEYRRGDVPAPPLEIGLCLGDFLQAARASLDHSVYAISTAIHPDFERTGFPIALDEKVYEEAADRSLGCVPDEVRAVVKRFQPFVDGAGIDDPLWQLHEMAIIDRHRDITLLASVVATEGVGWSGTVPSDENPDIRIYQPAVSAGELLCRVPSREQEPFRNFTPDIALSVVVGEGDRLAVRPDAFGLATEIRGRVWRVLLELDRIADELTEIREARGAGTE